MYISKISIKISKWVKKLDSKNKSIKNRTKKHYREILHGTWSLHMSIIFSSSFSLRNFCGETRRFMMEKPRLPHDVDGGISNVNLKSVSYKHTVNLAWSL